MIFIYAAWSRTEILAFIPGGGDLWEELSSPGPKSSVRTEKVEVWCDLFKQIVIRTQSAKKKIAARSGESEDQVRPVKCEDQTHPCWGLVYVGI